MKLSILIPVYNEKTTILELLAKIDAVDLGEIAKEVIIVDDCSKDGTKELLQGVANRYMVIFHEKNKGKGAAIRTALKAVTGDYVIIQDADLEYDPNDFKTMLQVMIRENLPVLFGSRRLKKQNKQYAGISYYLGGYLVTIITNVLFWQKLTDEPTCYKMFKADFIKKMPLTCERFEFCPEVTALTAKQGIRIREIPINYYPRDKEHGKKINWRDGIEAIWTLIKYRFI